MGVFWALFVGVCIYRTLGWRDIHAVLVSSAVSSGVILLIVAWAGLFAWAANTTGLVDTLSTALLTIADNGAWFLLMLNLMWLVLGMMMDAISIYYLTLPILLPVMHQLGWDSPDNLDDTVYKMGFNALAGLEVPLAGGGWSLLLEGGYQEVMDWNCTIDASSLRAFAGLGVNF